MYPMLTCNLAALAIAALYYTWRDLYDRTVVKERVLRERVAYMLWIAANR